MKNTVLLIILLIGYIKCSSEKRILNQNEIEFSNQFEYKEMINKLIITFDAFLEKKYTETQNSEERVALFVNDIEKMFISEDYKLRKKEMLHDFQVFNAIINELNSTDFFVDYKSYEKPKIEKWIDSLKSKSTLNQITKIDHEDIPITKKDTSNFKNNTFNKKIETSIISVSNKRINTEFYFYLYKEINDNEKFTKKWIERIFTWPGRSATYDVINNLKKEKNKELLNSPNIKLLIVTEIIIPHYDFSSEKFPVE